MIQFTHGDLLQTPDSFIAQGVAVGSQEGLGTGLALKISKKYPLAQKEFKAFTRNAVFKGGDVFVTSKHENYPRIIYIATQPDMYHATLSFLNKGLRNLVKWCENHNVERVSLPKIGAGLGKLDWEREVKPLLVQHYTDSSTLFTVYEEFRNEYEG